MTNRFAQYYETPTDPDGGLAPLPNRFAQYYEKPESDSRVGDSLKPYFGGRNPVAETYDNFVKPFVEEPDAKTKRYQDSRGLAERAGDTAAFIGSVPVRMLTQGKAGLGDAVGAIAPETGRSISRAESDFARANMPYLEAAKKAGDVAVGVPALNTMGRVPPANVPAPSKVPEAVSKANNIGLRSKPQQFVRPSDANAIRRAQLADDFTESGVTPFGPAFAGKGMQAYARTAGEQPFVGGPIQKATRNTFEEVKKARDRIADRYGSASTIEDAGDVADAGLMRFRDQRVLPVDESTSNRAIRRIVRAPTRDTSFKTKQDAMYERAWRNIPDEMREGRSVRDLPRVMGNPAHTMTLLRKLMGRNRRLVNNSEIEKATKALIKDGKDPDAAMLGREFVPVRGGLLGEALHNIANGNARLTLNTLRDLRSRLRRLSSGMGDTERNTLSLSDINRIESALTNDIISLLTRNARAYAAKGERMTAHNMRKAIREFKAADRFTRETAESMARIEKLFNAKTPEQLARAIERAAYSKGRGDLQALRILRSSLRGAEMDDITASVLRNMGTPTGSAARNITGEVGFSVSSFLTAWENMTPQARKILFGSARDRTASGDLNRLVRVIRSLADFESAANTSRTFTNALSTAIVGGSAFGAYSMPLTTFMSVLGTWGVSKMLTSQRYVRWMTRAADLERMYSRSRSPVLLRRLNEHWAELRPLLNDDPALAAEVARVLSAQTANRPEQ